MPLPTSRDKTFTAGDIVEASFLNNVQDQIVLHETDINAAQTAITDLQAGKRGERTRVITPAAGTFVNCSWSDTNASVDATAAPWNAQIPLTLFEGERIKSVTISRFGTGSGSINLTLRRVTTGNARSNVGTNTVSNPAGSWLDLAITGLTETVSGGTEYYLYIDGSTIGQRVNRIRIVTDVP